MFKPAYLHWTSHREKVSHINVDIDMDTPSSNQQRDDEHVNRYEDMVFDVVGLK